MSQRHLVEILAQVQCLRPTYTWQPVKRLKSFKFVLIIGMIIIELSCIVIKIDGTVPPGVYIESKWDYPSTTKGNDAGGNESDQRETLK